MRSLALALLLVAAPVGAAQPNVVVVMTDDLDDQSIQLMLALGVLPNIQSRIASPGVRFVNSFATNAICAPSRTTYLTGQYSHNHGVLTNTPPNGSVSAFNDASTIATALSSDYHTIHVGKYVNAYGSDPLAPPTNALNPSYVPPGWSDWRGLIDPRTYLMYGYSVNVNGTPTLYGNAPSDFQTSVLGDIAASSAAAALASDRPLFLTIAPVAPHNSYVPGMSVNCPLPGYAILWCGFPYPDVRDQTLKPSAWNLLARLPVYHALKPAFNEADVSDKPPAMQRPLMTATDFGWFTLQYRTRYLSMLQVDDAVGKVASALGAQLANTVWIFTSDNGWLNGEHRLNQKMAAYEESIRVPLYIAGPGYPPRAVTSLVLNNDLAPTIREIAGLSPDPLADGRSLVPLLLGATPSDWRRRFLVEHWIVPEGSLIDVPGYVAVRTGPSDVYPNRLYVEYADGARELYDLGADVGELRSLHAEPARAHEIADLHAALAQLRGCAGASCTAAED